MPQTPLPASKPIYFILDVRDCYEDKDAAYAAAKAMDECSEGYIFLYKLQPGQEFAPLVEAMPEGEES
jgi:hypothetical protein